MAKKIKLYLCKTGDRLEFQPYQEDLYREWVSKVKEDQIVEIQMKINRRMKTLPQLSYYHGVMLPFAVEGFRELGHDVLYVSSLFGEGGEIKTTSDSMDIYFKDLFQVHKGLDKQPRKRDMAIDEFSEFITFLLKWLVEKPGLYCPTPKE